MKENLPKDKAKAPQERSIDHRFNTSGEATASLVAELKKRSIDGNHPSRESSD